MSNKTHSDGTVTLGRPTKLPPGTRVIHNGDAGTIVEPAGWTMFDDEYRVQLDAAPGGYTRDWVLRADELTVLA